MPAPERRRHRRAPRHGRLPLRDASTLRWILPAVVLIAAFAAFAAAPRMPAVVVGPSAPFVLPTFTPAPPPPLPDPALIRSRLDDGAPPLQVALTFDDGWSAEALQFALPLLASEQIRATLFLNGHEILRHQEILRPWVAHFDFGRHTFSHRDLRGMSDAQIAADCARDDQAFAALGIVPLPLFRPPYGSRDARTDAAAARCGAPLIALWSADTADAMGATARHIATVAGRAADGEVVLLHLGPPATLRALPGIIARLRARGARLLPLYDLYRAWQRQQLPAPAPLPDPDCRDGGAC
jgi:peptidoglycan/xylan/chitin deacetylase (PgdA/CDA1 family)